MRIRELKTCWLALFLVSYPGFSSALESDRQQQLLINADATDGTLGDGMAILRGKVEIRQGSLLVRADLAEVEKVEGRVRQVVLTGSPALLQQEIENEGLVTATALSISYQVATGIVTLTGAADVKHPQYHISGEVLTYDMNKQHFQGNGGDANGRIRIELAPEVVPEIKPPAGNQPADDASGESLPAPTGDMLPNTAGDRDAEG
ncbi:MAG TPA: lipopolysaccharide transport periplasmic protein LptA [Xanthomonadales bacterium]|nr:lipopolysaccharide transport periplasmic protein LptA [Xanthomonadales bacterium]